MGAELRVEATVDPGLRRIHGTIHVDEGASEVLPWSDPLALLPEPGSDLDLFRTYPGAPDRGQVVFTQTSPTSWAFESELPRRYGAIGATRHGLFANGGWYPQPAQAGPHHWQVQVQLPEGTLGALGDQAGAGRLSWVGEGETVALAALPGGQLRRLEGAGEPLLLTRRRASGRLVRELEMALPSLPRQVDGVVVVAPLRRRLVRHGPGLAYLSDRAFRLTPGLEFSHRRAVLRGLAAAWVDRPSAFQRELVAAGLSQRHAQALRGAGADQVLGFFSWVPQVNALLSSQRIAFYGDILNRVQPTDRVRDSLVELVAPHSAGSAVVAQLDDRYGPGTGLAFAEELLWGATLDEAASTVGVDAQWVGAWAQAYPEQDYTLVVGDDLVQITREAPAGVPDEELTFRQGGEPLRALFSPGEVLTLPKGEGGVVLDPDLHVGQISRVRDSWPARYSPTFATWVGTLNLTQGQVFGSLWASNRRQYDTHNLVAGSLSNSRANLVAATLMYLRKEGPLLDGYARPHVFRVSASTSVLSERFADTQRRPVAFDGSVGWTWDTRVSSDFPLRGRQLSLGAGSGFIPSTPQRWFSVSGVALGLAPLHPRHVLAARVTGALAHSSVPHRRLTLGGVGAMRSIPSLPACPSVDDTGAPVPCTELADRRLVAMGEYRWAPLRGWSVPMGLVWGTELQLTGGVEAVLARVAGQPAWATGATLGVLGLGDVLGAETMGVGVTLGLPIAWSNVYALEEASGPEVYLRWAQAF